MVTVGEYGIEALDGHETMARNYPAHWPPTPTTSAEVLSGHVGAPVRNVKQVVGFRGRTPGDLHQYIDASRTYQC